MQIHQLIRVHKWKKPRAVGRGGKRGKTSGKGTKGQNARAGRKKRPELRDLIKKLPKMRGRGKNSNKTVNRNQYVALNLAVLESKFNTGDTVNPTSLVAKGVFKLYKGKNPLIKILSTGDLTKKLTLSGCHFSTQVKEKIEKAGGKVIN